MLCLKVIPLEMYQEFLEDVLFFCFVATSYDLDLYVSFIWG